MSAPQDPAIQIMLQLVRTSEPLFVVGGLTLVPIVAPRAAADADLLEDAHHEITELGGGGVVNAIHVRNLGTRPLLILDGEEVVGAKQNRIFNASFLIPPQVTVEIPVSCVEQGRWEARSSTFRTASRTISTGVRSAKLRRVTESALAGSSYDAGQGAVWADVTAHLRRTTTISQTMAYADAADAQLAGVAARIAGFAPRRDQVGHVAVARDRLLVVELLGSPALYKRAWPKLARGLLAEDVAPGASPQASEIAARAVASLRAASFMAKVAPGSGRTLHSATNVLVAGAVANEAVLYHLLATPTGA